MPHWSFTTAQSRQPSTVHSNLHHPPHQLISTPIKENQFALLNPSLHFVPPTADLALPPTPNYFRPNKPLCPLEWNLICNLIRMPQSIPLYQIGNLTWILSSRRVGLSWVCCPVRLIESHIPNYRLSIFKLFICFAQKSHYCTTRKRCVWYVSPNIVDNFAVLHERTKSHNCHTTGTQKNYHSFCNSTHVRNSRWVKYHGCDIPNGIRWMPGTSCSNACKFVNVHSRCPIRPPQIWANRIHMHPRLH